MSEFAGAGKKAGLELWRIEKMVPVKMKCTGGFHTGDAYILLSTTTASSGALNWNIHFWLGSECSQDESGVAAYKTVELDESLGGGPVQYREVQGYESALFLSYFKQSGGIEYLPGGVSSGFRKVERGVYETRLLQLKGKRTVRVKEVPLAVSSLNRGDVFILDCGLKLYLFNGPDSNQFEKAKGVEVVQHINSDDRGGKAHVVLIHEDPKNEDFWKVLGGFKDPKSLPEGEPDSALETTAKRKLFKISDASGKMEFVDLTPSTGKLERSLLDTNDVFLMQSIQAKIFVWVGKGANLNEKKEATQRAVQYLEQNGLPKSTAIQRVSEGNETGSFKSEFVAWDPPLNFHNVGKSKTASMKESNIDVGAILSRKAAEDTPIDDGSGDLKIWVIKDFKKCEVPKEAYGQFFGGDSYILLYTYKKGRSENHIIYYWLGRDSTADEKGAAALLTVELDDSMGGKPVQIRVTQGKEPAHFRQLFKGRMIVFTGGHASGFDKAGGEVEQAENGLFHIRGTNSLNTCAIQVKEEAASLNSDDCFVLVTTDKAFTWKGVNGNADEATVAASTASILSSSYKGKGGREVVEIAEGSEPEDFWSALGGKADYPSSAPGEIPPQPPRLFLASTATGTFAIDEVDNFDQSDLNDEDVFLLDTFTQLFVWLGTHASAEERKKAIEFAQKYVAEADDGRDPEIPVIQVTAGQEPAMFSCHFHPWDPEYTKKSIFVDPYQAKLDALAAEQAKLEKEKPMEKGAVTAETVATKTESYTATGTYSIEDLKENKISGVDPTAKENYLSAADFKELFDMTKAEFDALAKWKKADLKKKVGLF